MVGSCSGPPRREHLVFPEGDEDKILRACQILLDEKIAHPILLGDAAKIKRKIEAFASYLPRIAIALIKWMWSWTRDGGKIMIGNVHPVIPAVTLWNGALTGDSFIALRRTCSGSVSKLIFRIRVWPLPRNRLG